MLEPSGDLLGRPQKAKLVGHDARQASVLCQLAALGAMCPIPGRAVGLVGPIASLSTIALDLATDRGRCSPDACGDRANRVTDHQGTRDLFPLSKRQRRLSGGRMPPLSDRILCTDEWKRLNSCAI
jgi:hypothetical protein